MKLQSAFLSVALVGLVALAPLRSKGAAHECARSFLGSLEGPLRLGEVALAVSGLGMPTRRPSHKSDALQIVDSVEQRMMKDHPRIVGLDFVAKDSVVRAAELTLGHFKNQNPKEHRSLRALSVKSAVERLLIGIHLEESLIESTEEFEKMRLLVKNADRVRLFVLMLRANTLMAEGNDQSLRTFVSIFREQVRSALIPELIIRLSKLVGYKLMIDDDGTIRESELLTVLSQAAELGQRYYGERWMLPAAVAPLQLNSILSSDQYQKMRIQIQRTGYPEMDSFELRSELTFLAEYHFGDTPNVIAPSELFSDGTPTRH